MSRPLRVLIVEDSEDDTQLLLRELRRGGYDPVHERVETAAAMERALAGQEWNMVIADYSIPNFNSMAALALLKERGYDLPFIIVSGTISEETAVATMKAGAHDYLLKGNLKRLLPAIERELREAESRRERRKAEEELRKSQKLKGSIIQSALDCIIVMDHQGLVIEFNPAAESTFGYAREAVLGKPLANLIIPPSLREQHRQGLARYLATGEDPVLGKRIEITAMRADGTEFPVELSITPMGFEGQPIFTAFLRDLSERKQLEQQFRQAQKMESVGQLAGGIAHDFNNMLTVIMGYSALLLQKLRTDDPLRSLIEKIKVAGERASLLTKQLLAFSRKQVLQPRVLDLNAVLTNIDQLLQRLIGEDIGLITVPAPGLGRVKVDPSQIEQVIVNLTVNARNAMPQGGKLTIETANVELGNAYAREHVSVTPGPYVMLAVSDTGCGMNAETQARIFEPFFTTKEPGKGTGLGLSTVYGIVKQSDGNIWVYSEPGRGSTFKIYLPRIEEAVETVEPGAVPTRTFRGSETILLVEDEDSVRRLARSILQANGYTVLEAHHGKEAILLSGRHEGPIHLMITDIVMPEMSGRELAERLKPSRPDMKVLFMSGYTDKAIVHHGELDPGTEFLQKPFTPDALLRKVREGLDANH